MTFTINDIEKSYLKQIEKIASNKRKTEKEVINNIIKKGLETEKERLKGIPKNILKNMVNKDTYDSDGKSFESLKGSLTVPPGFDIVKEIEESNVERFDL